MPDTKQFRRLLSRAPCIDPLLHGTRQRNGGPENIVRIVAALCLHQSFRIAAIAMPGAIDSQVGTFALVPQIADAVSVPVIAAGGIGDGRGMVAAFGLGAAGVQIGTAFLLCAESATPPPHREALRNARMKQTVVTNVFSGRPARVLVNRPAAEFGPWSDAVPDFPLPMGELPPLRAAAEQNGSTDFTPLWSGQAAALAREMPAKMLIETLVREATKFGGG